MGFMRDSSDYYIFYWAFGSDRDCCIAIDTCSLGLATCDIVSHPIGLRDMDLGGNHHQVCIAIDDTCV